MNGEKTNALEKENEYFLLHQCRVLHKLWLCHFVSVKKKRNRRMKWREKKNIEVNFVCVLTFQLSDKMRRTTLLFDEKLFRLESHREHSIIFSFPFHRRGRRWSKEFLLLKWNAFVFLYSVRFFLYANRFIIQILITFERNFFFINSIFLFSHTSYHNFDSFYIRNVVAERRKKKKQRKNHSRELLFDVFLIKIEYQIFRLKCWLRLKNWSIF